MSLGIVFKGPEGIVLAADSRVTLMSKFDDGAIMPSTFDNTLKLLRVNGQEFVGIITYGLGAFGKQPRTAYSYIPEFEAAIKKGRSTKRLKVEEVARKLSEFFMRQWKEQGMPKPEEWKAGNNADMVFLLGGYDEKEPYGRVFEIDIPSQPKPKELHFNTFGPVWGGQQEFVGRLIHGHDPSMITIIQKHLSLSDEQVAKLRAELKNIEVKIPYQFLPLQDCINLSILLVRTTIEMQSFYVGLRGVGGDIDVAVITKTGGFQSVQEKDITKFFNPREARI
jgi:hypothetical protein